MFGVVGVGLVGPSTELLETEQSWQKFAVNRVLIAVYKSPVLSN